jgi:predicted naringenin-chalcone synthase
MTHTPASLLATGIALPPRVDTARFLELDQIMRARHGQSREIRESIKKFVANSRIDVRHSVNPCWQPDDKKDPTIEDIFTPYDFDPPAHLRAKFWHEHSPKLAIRAAQAALANWGGSVKDITHVVTTTTTGWAEPGIAVELIEKLGLSEDTRKIEININGCFCGASCLRTARDIVRGGEAGVVLVVAVELASVQYNITETDMSQLVSSSLFSDGAGAAIVGQGGAWNFDFAGMSLVPNSKHLLSLTPDYERESNASKMFLHPDVSKSLATYFRDGRGSRYLDDFLRDKALPPDLAVHPGGPNILEGIQSVLLERGWPGDCLQSSFKTLRETGNLGSAAMLFVLHHLLQTTTAQDLSYLAFGPGVTVEWGQLSRAKQG